MPELEETVRENVVGQLGLEKVAAAVLELETDDAVELIEELEDDARQAVLDALPDVDRVLIEEALAYPEDSAGRLIPTD